MPALTRRQTVSSSVGRRSLALLSNPVQRTPKNVRRLALTHQRAWRVMLTTSPSVYRPKNLALNPISGRNLASEVLGIPTKPSASERDHLDLAFEANSPASGTAGPSPAGDKPEPCASATEVAPMRAQAIKTIHTPNP